MNERAIDRPIFVIGMPRSGTTILFEALARHPSLGWLSNYCRMYPRSPWVNVLRRVLDNPVIRLHGHKKQYGSAAPYNLWLPQPDEAYEFWDTYSGVPFSTDSLRERRCEPQPRSALRDAAARVVSWQHRDRFAAKLTGPSRIGFLSSVFPNSIFVHVIRDGRAVTHSLLNVRFWQRRGGLERPFWSGLLGPDDVQLWERSARDSAVLAAVQWKRVIELARIEAKAVGSDRYVEIRYEDFTADPHLTMAAVMRACDLSDATAVHEYLEMGPRLENMNAKFRDEFTPEAVRLVSSTMQPVLDQLGYA